MSFKMSVKAHIRRRITKTKYLLAAVASRHDLSRTLSDPDHLG